MSAFVHFPSTIRVARWHSGRKHLVDLHTETYKCTQHIHRFGLCLSLSFQVHSRAFVRSSARSLIVLVRRLIPANRMPKRNFLQRSNTLSACVFVCVAQFVVPSPLSFANLACVSILCAEIFCAALHLCR